MNRAMGFAQRDFNPRQLSLSDVLLLRPVRLGRRLVRRGSVPGRVLRSLAAFERAFFVEPTLIYLAGRTLSVALRRRDGVRHVPPGRATGSAGRQAPPPRYSWPSRRSRSPTRTTSSTMSPSRCSLRCTSAVLADLVQDATRGEKRSRWMLAGLLAGLAMSTHYYAVFLVLPLTIAALHARRGWRAPPTRVRRLAACGAACVRGLLRRVAVHRPRAVHRVARRRREPADRDRSRDVGDGRAGIARASTGRWLSRDAAGMVTFWLACGGRVVATVTGWRGAMCLCSPSPSAC